MFLETSAQPDAAFSRENTFLNEANRQELTVTNAERKTSLYTQNKVCTVPSTVTNDTSLSELNLNWSEKELRERDRTKHVHRLHPYLGKYIPQLVEIFLRKYFQAGQTVLDPFAGSGTTLVQANELGINSVGFDISAFNVLLCKAKTARYNVAKVKAEILNVLEIVRQETQSDTVQPQLWQPNAAALHLEKSDNEYLQKWFAPQALRELLVYRRVVEEGSYRYKNLLKIILCRSARSSRLTTHFDLDFPKHPQTEPYHCYKHARTCSPTQTAFKFIERYSLDTVERVTAFSLLRSDARVSVHHSDSQLAKIPRIDGVITSPPYVGLIDYHEQHAYAYHLLGLKDKRAKEIGAAAKGSGRKAQEAYQIEIANVFRRIKNAMPKGGRIIVVAGDRASVYPKIAELAEVEVEAEVIRHVNRRTGRRSTEFYESVFIWRKP